MENIRFEITEEDIKKYLKEHKDDYKYREALFIKYLKENKNSLIKETIQILFERNGIELVEKQIDINTFNNLPSFNNKSLCSNNIRNLDLSGICHILIPAIRYYDWDRPGVPVGRIYSDLDMVARNLNVHIGRPWEVLESTLDNYQICEKVEVKDGIVNFKMGREHSRRELVFYQDYYDEDKVKRIRKIIRDGK